MPPEDQHPAPFGSEAETAPIASRPGTGLGSGFATRAAPEKPPERIGPFKVVREIGRGGMGVVYLGQREDGMRQRVAIKVVKKGMDSEDILRRFDMERRVLAALNHPNVARLVDGGTMEDGRPYFVVEFVEGLPIDRFCDARRLRISERLELFRKVCSAVQYAHQNLIVHRDLKPSNILVTQDGEPKLLDFGIAKLLNPEMTPVDHTPTAAELRLMTPEYASPEQVRGEPLSTSSDVYSLGVVLYELLTGHRPYRLRTRAQAEIVRVICEVDPERPSTAISKVEEVPDGLAAEGSSGPASAGTGTGQTGASKTSTRTVGPAEVSRTREGRPERLRRRLEGDIDNIVLMAMRKEPQRRYASADQLADDLRRHLAGLPVIARQDSVWYRGTKFVTRNKFWVASAAALFLSLTAGIAGTTWQWRNADKARALALVERDQKEEARAAEVVQRGVAENRLNNTLALTKTYIYDTYDAINKLAGATKAMEATVSTGVKYLESIEKEGADDPRIQDFLIDGYNRMGEVTGGVRGSNLGEPQKALDYFRKALTLAEALKPATPDAERQKLKEVSRCHRGIADTLGQLGKREEALAAYRTSLALNEQVAQRWPEDREGRRALAVDTTKIADRLTDLGLEDAAREHNAKSLAMRRALAAEKPDVTSQRDLTIGIIRIINDRLETGDTAGAKTLLAELLTLRSAALSADPDQGRAQRDMVRARRLEADVQAATDDVPGAMKTLRDALTVCDSLAEADPANSRAQLDILDLKLPLIELLAKSGDIEGARREAAATVTIAEQAAVRFPQEIRIPAYHAQALLAIGQACLEADRPADAIEALHSAQAVAQATLDRDPENVENTRRVQEVRQAMDAALAKVKQSSATPK